MKKAIRNWRDDAACIAHDPELFFPIGTVGPALEQAERARQVCRDCPVKLPCLEAALRIGADHGIWGGLDEHERRALRPIAERRTQPSAPAENRATL